MTRTLVLLALASLVAPAGAETTEEAKQRHAKVAGRRAGVGVICHRGACEVAHENTLEAFRATFELGGDGNEIDVRRTNDGVLVVFHDDMLDRLLEAYGAVGDYPWALLKRFRFRNAGPFRGQCRIPMLAEVFALHLRYGGLLHLDIKDPRIDEAVADLLTRMDMWEHVAHCNADNGRAVVRDARYKPRTYKAPGLFEDRGEVFPDVIAAALKKPGDDLIADDPRGIAVALGRKPGLLSAFPVSLVRTDWWGVTGGFDADPAFWIDRLRSTDWDKVAESPDARLESGERIRQRAAAAEALLAAGVASKEALAALEDRVRHRSLHKEWMYHGFDGAMALRTLIVLRAPAAVELARFTLWRDDPALDPVVDPRFKNPRAWTDFRVKMVVFPALEKYPGPATEGLCRDYLALSDADARSLGPPQFEPAARTLLAVSPRTETALELMKHRLQAVRGRAVFDCLARSNEAWARAALSEGAPHALAYIPPE